MQNNNKKLLLKSLHENHLILSQEAIVKIIQYLALLQKWNDIFNLTAIKKPEDMILLHIIDSLIIMPLLHGQHILDVGTGAGLPGLPLAICNPERDFVLLDKTSKKVRFLTQVLSELQVSNVSVVNCRSENYHPEKCFDSILSRAFGTLKRFAESTKHLLCPNGFLLALKGQLPQNELEEIKACCLIESITPLKIYGSDIKRHVIRFKIK